MLAEDAAEKASGYEQRAERAEAEASLVHGVSSERLETMNQQARALEQMERAALERLATVKRQSVALEEMKGAHDDMERVAEERLGVMKRQAQALDEMKRALDEMEQVAQERLNVIHADRPKHLRTCGRSRRSAWHCWKRLARNSL